VIISMNVLAGEVELQWRKASDEDSTKALRLAAVGRLAELVGEPDSVAILTKHSTMMNGRKSPTWVRGCERILSRARSLTLSLSNTHTHTHTHTHTLKHTSLGAFFYFLTFLFLSRLYGWFSPFL
jgi:hypothetical protein